MALTGQWSSIITWLKLSLFTFFETSSPFDSRNICPPFLNNFYGCT
ncbi:hypothetical protein KC19_2G151400 [Ceratodon purpureus]|uniref:Uncharacterized protein n=1 Tax=Ceratodon purpureus TaxID=3225 RepID=A0A8T0IX03_CERPU|nr:hypothetical protein KC19_2G151400 [Ceratodon purpureus]